MARNSAQTKADAAIAKSRAQVLALGGSIEVFQEPVVEEATQVPSRKRKSATAQGAVASSPEYREELRRTREANEAKVAEKKAKREERTRTFSLKWAPLVEKAEDLVLKHAPTSAADFGALLKVGELKAFIVSRTGRPGAAKNNNRRHQHRGPGSSRPSNGSACRGRRGARHRERGRGRERGGKW